MDSLIYNNASNPSLETLKQMFSDFLCIPPLLPVQGATKSPKQQKGQRTIIWQWSALLSPSSYGPPLAPTGEAVQLQMQRSAPMYLKSSPHVHVYHPPWHLGPMPQFQDGCHQFPVSKCWFWHPVSNLNHYHHEWLLGQFDEEDFLQWWRRRSQHIEYCWINNIKLEKQYGGIYCRITTNPGVWENQVLLQGDPLIFWGLDSDEIKYFITWTINKHHDNKYAYVQVNAFNQFQGNLDSSDIDWPALGFLVPKSLCEVLNSQSLPAIPTLPLLTNPFDLNPHIAPELPELQPPVQSMNCCHCSHVWEKPLFGFKSFASLNVLTSCKRPLGNEEDLEQGDIPN